MGAFSEFTQQDHEVIARDYADLKEAARKRCADPAELEVIQKAFDFANEAHKKQKRKSGEPYIIHPVEVAEIVAAELMLDANTVIAETVSHIQSVHSQERFLTRGQSLGLLQYFRKQLTIGES